METTTAGEAAQQVMDKKLATKSSRINWEALQVRSLLDRLEESGIDAAPVTRATASTRAAFLSLVGPC